MRRAPPVAERERQKKGGDGGNRVGRRRRPCRAEATGAGDRSQAESAEATGRRQAEGAEGARRGAAGKGRRSRLAKPLPKDGAPGHTRAPGGSGGWRHPCRGSGRPARAARRRRLAIKERGEKPRGGFSGRDEWSARPKRQGAYRRSFARQASERAAVAVQNARLPILPPVVGAGENAHERLPGGKTSHNPKGFPLSRPRPARSAERS